MGGRKTTSIIILTWNQLHHTKECVASIQRHTPEPHEIIFVDNGSTDGTLPWLQELEKVNPQYRLIANQENRGFAAGCNQGLAVATGESLLLLNNDVVVTPGWLTSLLVCLTEEPDRGVVGPMTNAASGPQMVERIGYASLFELDTFAATFHGRNRFRRVPCHRLAGFCLLFKRELLERVGQLDEQFGTGNFEDDDFCYRAALDGYQNVIAADVFIHHHGSASFDGNNLDYGALLRQNRGLFLRKWHAPQQDQELARKILAVQTMDKAVAKYLAWDLDGAITLLLDEGIRYLPDDPRCYLALTEFLLDAGRWRDALDVLASAPRSANAIRFSLLEGEAMLGMGDLATAEATAREVFHHQPDNRRVLGLLGSIELARNNNESARRHFTAAIKAGETSGRPYTCLGLLRLHGEDVSEGVELLEKGVQLSPLSAFSVDSYHRAVVETGAFDRGVATFRDALRYFPDSRSLHYLLIDLLIKANHSVEALRQIEEVMVRFGVDEGMLAPALELRSLTGPKSSTDGSLLSLCMIVKDESEHLPRCLANLSPLVNEMIVVDTGSSDSTRAIAEIFGARVIDFPWNGDFAAARNYSLEQARGEWILVMDADEVITRRDHAAIRQLLAGAHPESPTAFALVTRNYTRRIDKENWQPNLGQYPAEEAGVGWIPSCKVRIFPNRPAIRFENAIHELVEPALERLNITIVDAPLPVHHYGELDNSRQQRKAEEYYRIGRQKLAVAPGDIKVLFELAVQAGEIGRYEEAISLWGQVLTINPGLPAAYLNLGYNHLQLNNFTQALTATGQALSLQRGYPEAIANLAYCLICLNRAEEAIILLKDVAAEGDIPVKLHLMLGVAFGSVGEIGNGLVQLKDLSRQQIDFLPFIKDMIRKLTVSQNNDIVVRLLEMVISGGYGDEEIERQLGNIQPKKPL